MAYSNSVSVRVRSQIPSYLADTHPLFPLLMEAYYEYLEINHPTLQRGRAVQRARSLRDYRDVDTTIDDFLNIFYKEFLSLVPRNAKVDKSLLLKKAKDFYRSRGTEKSYKLLVRILSDGTKELDFYYPSRDILRASHSTWYIQKSIRVLDVQYDNVSISASEITKFYYFEGLKIYGVDSGASAIVDDAAHFFDAGYLIDELTLSSISGRFAAGENVYTIYTDTSNVDHYLSATINPGIVAEIQVTAPGYGYSVGYQPPIESVNNSPGIGAVVEVSKVTVGSVNAISVLYGGSGFRANDYLLFVSGSGSGANAYITSTIDTGDYHPNTYNIDVSTISLESNTLIGNTTYTNLNSSNANTTVANAINTFLYANTGPAFSVIVAQEGSDYTEIPTMSAIGNTRIQALGILGRMNVVNSGTGYIVGDTLTFVNPFGTYGMAASANVINVDGSGAIMNVAYTEVTGFPLGGMGYDNDNLPTVDIVSGSGSGAYIKVDNCLGFGAKFTANLTTIGGILKIDVVSPGTGYNIAPYVNLSQSGSGTATATANILLGLYTYPGRYLDDTGHLSSYNFLEDRDYYQNYSYVMRADESLSAYEKAINALLHPAGTKLFSEFINDLPIINLVSNSLNTIVTTGEFYDPNVVYFDGNTYFKTNNETVTGNTIQEGTISLWFYPETTPANTNVQYNLITFGSTNSSYVALINTETANSATGVAVEVKLCVSNGTNLSIKTDANTTPMYVNNWYHVLCSYSIDPLYFWNFDQSSSGFTAVLANIVYSSANGTILLKPTTADPQLNSPQVRFEGIKYNKIRARIRSQNYSVNWQGACYFKTTTLPSFSGSFWKSATNPLTANNEWGVVEWDMTSLTTGGNTWIANTITQIRMDFFNGTQNVEVDWVAIGESFTGNTKSMIYLSNVECTSNILTVNIGGTVQSTLNAVVGGAETNTNFTGSMTEVLVSNVWIDISDAGVRRLFSNNDTPINLNTGILTSNTTFANGVMMYFKGDANTANYNYGSGNTFPVIIGSITDSDISPTD